MLLRLLLKQAKGRMAYYLIGLVKTGPNVLVSVRNALTGSDLSKLRAAVERDFLATTEQAQQVRAVMAKLESGFIHKFVSFKQH